MAPTHFFHHQSLDTIALNDDINIMVYPGGKNGSGTYQKIINLMPPHDVYIEPFLGSGAIMRYKKPAKTNIGIDADPASPFMTVPAAIAKNDDESGRTVISDDDSSYRYILGNGIDYLSTLVPIVKKSDSMMIYCDPPYLHQTRSDDKIYNYEMSDEDHDRLLLILTSLKCMIVISGYQSEFYNDRLKKWNKITFEAMTRWGGMKEECLWFNFETPTKLHDYQFLGKDFRERERIGRKKKRWVNKLGKMSTLERQALLSAINETWGMEV